MKAGELFAGFGGLAMAVGDVFGSRTAWVVENDPAASRVLDMRFGVPNHGDVRTVDWGAVEPVDILAGGYPCPGESQAGRRLGDKDPRWMWPAYRDAVAAIRPRWVVGENVAAHLSLSFRHVVADILGLGYAVAWAVVSASDVGAPHRRARVFWLAWPLEYGTPLGMDDAPFAELHGGEMVTRGLFDTRPCLDWPVAGAAYAGAAWTPPLLPTARTTDANGAGSHGEGGLDLRTAVSMLPTPTSRDHKGHNQRGDGSCLTGALLPTPAAADADCASHAYARGNPTLLGALLPTPKATDGTKGGPNQRGSSGALTLPSAVQPERFGPYAPAVARWEALTRLAPDPTEPGRKGEPRLPPRFVEWLMGAPEGHFTAVPGVTRAQQLRMGGNGVVRQQGREGLRWLLARAPGPSPIAAGAARTEAD